MSSTYHFMRNFIAIMRSLGYPREISIENFRYPNFALMADILVFLLERFDPEAKIEKQIENENERLRFVLSASHLMVNRANLDINVKKLYMADINSVQEMIKLAKLIQDVWNVSANKNDPNRQANGNEEKDYDEDDRNDQDSGHGDDEMIRPFVSEETELRNIADSHRFDQTMISNFNSFKKNQITSDIYETAANFYDSISVYDKNKNDLQKAIVKQMSIDQIESSIRESIQILQQGIIEMQNRKETFERDIEDLDVKIERKQNELNRNKKRLQNVNAQRPSYMDELEKIEEEIVQIYDQYVSHSRCLFFLEQKIEEFEELERLKIECNNNRYKHETSKQVSQSRTNKNLVNKTD
ncbi:hypothetical protein NH340_JMT04816 [Sarcoptes scabiei]|nr:hypothetical protein NH340_JMT04816 [Sarcoptes scabiei]